jgi:hypothetical protein
VGGKYEGSDLSDPGVSRICGAGSGATGVGTSGLRSPVGTSCTNGMCLASNSASSPLSIVTGHLLLGFLERFPSLIGFHSNESCAAFNLFM